MPYLECVAFDAKEFGRRLRSAREGAGYSRKALMDEYRVRQGADPSGGRSGSQLADWENGDHVPAVAVVADLAKILKADTNELLGVPSDIGRFATHWAGLSDHAKKVLGELAEMLPKLAVKKKAGKDAPQAIETISPPLRDIGRIAAGPPEEIEEFSGNEGEVE